MAYLRPDGVFMEVTIKEQWSRVQQLSKQEMAERQELFTKYQKEYNETHDKNIYWEKLYPLIVDCVKSNVLKVNEKGEPDWSKVPYNYDNEPLKRHYPIDLVNQFISLFRAAHPETAIILYQLPNEPAPDGVFRFTIPYLAYHVLARKDECVGVVTIDSSLQHLVAGLTKTLVIWGHSLPLSFGYDYNKNILQDCRRDDILYFSALGPSGAAIRYIKPDALLKEVDSYLFGKEEN